MSVTEYILIAFPAIFVILNPFTASTTFLSMTMEADDKTQAHIAKRACLTAFGILTVFAIAGHLIFQMFHITVEAFRIAGGIILFSIGLEMLNLKPLRSKQTEEEKEEMLKRQNQDIGIMPLGMPIMAGPGAITTVIVLMGEVSWKSKVVGTLQSLGLFISIALCCILFYYILTNARKLMNLFKITLIGVLTRIMGMILTVIATQFVINGVKDLLPKFSKLLS